VTKPANNLTLQLKDSNEATAKSKSLPRGLPSDESAFNQFQGPHAPPASLTTASETTLEPKQPQVIYRFLSCSPDPTTNTETTNTNYSKYFDQLDRFYKSGLFACLFFEEKKFGLVKKSL
jgi:hypothetical protein